MILTCPECSTRYQANDAAFQPPGRRVRCAKCGHSWHQAAPVAEVEAEVAPEVEVEPPPVQAAPAPAPKTRAQAAPEAAEAPPAKRGFAMDRLALAGGWLGLAVVVLLIGWAAVSYRQQVAALWPQSATLYAALGLPVNVHGIAFTDVSYHRESEDKQTVLAVTGKLVNVSGREIAVPPVRVTLTGEDGRELYHWDFTPDVAVLRAGQSVDFQTRLSSPPSAARHLTVRFADSKG